MACRRELQGDGPIILLANPGFIITVAFLHLTRHFFADFLSQGWRHPQSEDPPFHPSGYNT